MHDSLCLHVYCVMYLLFKFKHFGSIFVLFRNVADWLTQISYFMSYLTNNNALLKELYFSVLLGLVSDQRASNCLRLWLDLD